MMEDHLKQISLEEKRDPESVKSLCQDLLARLCEQKEEGKLCDVQLFNGKSQLWAHSCVLAAFSPFMMRFFVTYMKGDKPWSFCFPFKIHIAAITKCLGKSRNNCMDCVSKVVNFIYTGKIKLESKHIDHIVNISSNLEIDSLIMVCQRYKNDKLSRCTNGLKNIDDSERKVAVTNERCGNSDSSQNELPLLKNNQNDLQDLTNTLTASEEVSFYPKEDDVDLKLSRGDFNTDSMKEMDQLIKLNCNESSNSDNEIVEHNEDSKEEDENECKLCCTQFSNNAILKQHLKVFHTRKYSCLVCDFSSYKLIFMLKHLIESNHCEKTCSICLFEAQNNVALMKHYEDHRHNLPFLCNICDERFKVRTDWHRHMLIHSTEKAFICKYCDMSFKKNSYVKNHIQICHKKTKHLCEQCGYTTPFLSFLVRHKLKHGDKTISCSVEGCTFTTYREFNLKEHLKTHENEKPFKCRICNVTFSLDKNLRRHMQLVHNPNASTFKCPGCSYSYSRIDKVKEHCKRAHDGDEKITKILHQLYEKSKTLKTQHIIPKYSRTKVPKPITKNKINNSSVSHPQELSSQKECNLIIPSTTSCFSEPLPKNTSINASQPLLSSVINTTERGRDNPQGTITSSSKQTVFLSETTGEITIIGENKGQPISIASVTSTNLLTIGNFREGTGSVTLNETTGVLTLNNINSESTGAVFLNESTGVLSYINLNNDNCESMKIDDCNTNSFTGFNSTEPATLLNEETGEISTVPEKIASSNLMNDDDMFDSFDIDMFNEDSFDGFDEFDGYLFDTFGNNGVENESEMVNFLNEFTGELLVDSKTAKEENNLSANLSSVTQSSKSIAQNIAWDNVCPIDLNMTESNNVFNQTLLNEVTGELVLNQF